MERLEPILKQKFWILLGIGIVMTAAGWWVGTGSQAATIATRTKIVSDAFSSVPSGEIPNTDWTNQLSARNAEQDRAIRSTSLMLWNRQRDRMYWPVSLQAMAWENGYRGNIRVEGCEIYRTAYGYEVRRVWESLRPYIQQDGTGIVVYGQDEKILPQKVWGRLAPSPAEMWDAQEDLWLIESVFRSIVAVNGGPEAPRGDASIHMMEKFMLFGGEPAASRKGTGGGGGGGGAAPGGAAGPTPGGAHGASATMPSGGFGGGMGGELGGQRTAAVAPVDFEPKEEVGDDGSKGAGGGLGAFGPGAMGGAPGGAHSAGPGGPATGPATGAAGTAGASTVKRYIEDEARFRTRGFYMTLVMDHRKIPALVAELSASEYSAWPAEVLRVQMVRLHDDDVGSGGTPGFAGGMSGMPAMSPSAASGTSAPPGYPNPRFQSSDSDDGGGGGAVVNPTAAAAAAAALESARQDPFMARVSIIGVITLYKEVKPDAPPPAAPAATPATPGAIPANPAAPGATPVNPAVPTSPTAPAAEGTPPATETPAEPGKPESTPAEPSATKPAEPTPTPPDATPKEPESPKAPEKN